MDSSTNIHPKGKTFITTQNNDFVNTTQIVGKLVLPNGSVAQVKRMWGTATSNATTDLIAAVADKCFRVLSAIVLHGGTAGTIKFVSHDGSSGTDISPTFSNAANGGFTLPRNIDGWFQCLAINCKLQATVSNSSDVSVLMTYIEIPDDCMDLL